MFRGFRRDVQGLRAIAVLFVALDHAAVGPFAGGFVGVDVFFVISGFLITSLLMAEADRDARISLVGFYSRRARRILPAATVVLLVTIAASVVFLSGVEVRSATEDAVWATLFLANVKFAIDGTDYFHAEAMPSPLQHFWSLAVEEQFYLVWPLVIMVICVLRRRKSSSGWMTLSAMGVVLVVVLASFIWSVVQTQNNAVVAYFSPLTRAWELGLGALTAFSASHLSRVHAHVLAGASWVGLVAVGGAAVAYDHSTPFPGYAATLPVLGAALLLVGGLKASTWGPQKLLTLMPMRLIGDWSYSFYLWHWPTLIIAASIWGPISGWSGLLVLTVALGISGLSHVLIENPFRRMRLISLRPKRGLLLYPAMVLLVVPLMGGADHVVAARVAVGGPWIGLHSYGQHPGDAKPDFSSSHAVALVQASVLAARNGVHIPHGLAPSLLQMEDDKPDVGECEYQYAANAGKLCPRGDTSGERTLVVIGDSHARQWAPALEALAKKHGYKAYYLVRVGCPGADVTPWLGDGSGPNIKCQEFQDWAADELALLQPDLTIIGSAVNPEGWTDDEGKHVTAPDDVRAMFREGMRREVERVAPNSGRVVLIGDPPSTAFQGSICLSRRGGTLKSCMSAPDARSLELMSAARAGAISAGADYVSTTAWFCAYDGCPAVIGHFQPRRDLQHVTVDYAAHLTAALEGKLHLIEPATGRREHP